MVRGELELKRLWLSVLEQLERQGIASDRAQDYVQEAFLHLIELNAGSRRGATQTNSGYVVKAAWNAYRDDVRVGVRRCLREKEWTLLASAQERECADSPSRRIDDAQRNEVFWAALETLPRDLIWPLLLCDGEDYTDIHAARELGLAVGTLKCRKRRARALVRKAYATRDDSV